MSQWPKLHVLAVDESNETGKLQVVPLLRARWACEKALEALRKKPVRLEIDVLGALALPLDRIEKEMWRLHCAMSCSGASVKELQCLRRLARRYHVQVSGVGKHLNLRLFPEAHTRVFGFLW